MTTRKSSAVTASRSAASKAKKPLYMKQKARNINKEQTCSGQRHYKEESTGRANAAMLRRLGDEKEVIDIDVVYGDDNFENDEAKKPSLIFTDRNINAASRTFSPTPVEAKAAAATVASATETAMSTSIYQLVMMIISTDADVVVKGLCGLLEAVADKRNSPFDIAVAVANSAVLSAMLIHADSPIIQAKACSLIMHMAVHARNQYAIFQEGGLDIILGAMDTHTEDFGVQKEAIGALDVLFSHDVIAQALGDFKYDEKRVFREKAIKVYSRVFLQAE
jgi:hypothetical protein